MNRQGIQYRRSTRWRRKLLVIFGVVFFVSNMSLPMNYGEVAAQAENIAEMSESAINAHRTEPMRNKEQAIVEAKYESVDERSVREIYQQLLQSDRPVQLTEQQQYKRPEQPTVYLTFDDGPSRLTPQILDILQEEGVPATFFVLGKLAEQNADTLQRIANEGHAIGNHTYDHDYSKLYTNFGQFFEQVERTDEVIYEITGFRTQLFRAPGGTYANFDAFYSYYMEQLGFVVYDWDVDSGDSKRRGVPASEIIANVKKSPLKHEMNVLLHDSAGHEETVNALPEIIRYYRDLGYTFAVLDRAVEPRRFTLTGLKWERSISEQQHMYYMERISRFRTEREADSIQLPHMSAPSGKQLTLAINGRTHVLEEDDYIVVEGHFQVPIERLAEGLGGKVVQRLDYGGWLWLSDRSIRGQNVTMIRQAERMLDEEVRSNSAARRMVRVAQGSILGSGERIERDGAMSRLSRPLRIDAELQGFTVSYFPYESMMEVHIADGRTVARSRVSLHMKDGRLFVPLRGTVEMLGGTIPSYTLTSEKQEVRIAMGSPDPGNWATAVAAKFGPAHHIKLATNGRVNG